MDTHTIRDASQIIADYRAWKNNNLSPIASSILDRLEKDPDGVVTAALNNHTLKRAHPGLLLFYLIQSIDLTKSHAEVTMDCIKKADEFRFAAEKADKLAEFCYSRVPIYLYRSLKELEKYFIDQKVFYSNEPTRLLINQKTTDENTALLAVRAFAGRLRKNFTFTRLPHDPIKWLIETALECEITENQLTEGLRLPKVGEIVTSKSPKSPRPANRLLSKNIL